jgi:hypothetical protein
MGGQRAGAPTGWQSPCDTLLDCARGTEVLRSAAFTRWEARAQPCCKVMKLPRGNAPPTPQKGRGGSTWTIQEVEELTLLLRQTLLDF